MLQFAYILCKGLILISKLLIISFDAVSDCEFERFLQYKSFTEFAGLCSTYRQVSSVFLSNTYPVHTSVITGKAPAIHGITSNTKPFPVKNPVWITNEQEIRIKTLWQAAAENNITTAAVLWPVTAFSKTIRYNIPEAHTLPGKNQILTNLASGSKLLQLKMFLKHGKLLDGINQPALDNFSTACMSDIIREHAPGLALIHLTAYDSICHQHGRNSNMIKTASDAMVKNLETLLKAAGDDYNIILFSDHGQLNVHTSITPNELLVEKGLLSEKCFFKCCGGSAFFHSGSLSSEETLEIKDSITKSEGFFRFLTDTEMYESGHGNNTFGFCAKEGYFYEAFKSKEKATHGYPVDMPGYKVFYMVRAKGFKQGSVTATGSLLDIAPIAAKLLGIKI